MKTSFYDRSELLSIGFQFVGENVFVSRKASIYSPEKITIGDNVRIDDFCILSGEIIIGSYVHISAYVAIYASLGVVLEDYTGLSPRVTIYSAMDDFSGDYLIGPIHNEKNTNVTGGLVRVGKYSHIGANTIIFPNLTIGKGVVVGCMSLVNSSLDEWGIYAGIPVKQIKERRKKLLIFVENVCF